MSRLILPRPRNTSRTCGALVVRHGGLVVRELQPLIRQGFLLRARARARMFFSSAAQRSFRAGVPSSVKRCVVALRVREWRSVGCACGPDPRSVLKSALQRSRRAARTLKHSSVTERLATLAGRPGPSAKVVGNRSRRATVKARGCFASASSQTAVVLRQFNQQLREASMPVREGEWRPLGDILSSVLLRLDDVRKDDDGAMHRPN